MVIRVAINGFGRIGRMVLRCALDNNNIDVVAINYPSTNVQNMCHIFKYDSIHGKLKYNVTWTDNFLIVDNDNNGNNNNSVKKCIRVFHFREIKDIPWNIMNIDIVIDATGKFKTMESASEHIKSGAKKVIVTCPSNDIPMFVMGVNENEYDSNYKIISNGSCTTNCIGPIIKLLDIKYGIDKGFITTIHSYTANQSVVDKFSQKSLRLGRNCNMNIIPSTTGAAIAIRKIYPAVNNKITGMSFRVPTSNVSIVDFTVRLNNGDSLENIINYIKESSNNLNNLIGWTNEELVSSDFIGDSRSSILDIKSCLNLGNNFFKLVFWYDNEWAYSNRTIDLANYINQI